MKSQIGTPILIGVILIALCLVGFLAWRTFGDSTPHETPAPAKNPEDNPMFKGMRESMKSSRPSNGVGR